MKTSFQILIVSGLTLGLAYGQESDSVQSVLNELRAYKGTAPAAAAPVAEKPVAAPAVAPAPAVVAAAPVAEKPVTAPAVAPAPVAVAAAPAVETKAEPVDVPAVLDASREQYVAGNYTEAEAGFKAVLGAEPGNKIAAFFMQQLADRTHRNAEETAVKAAGQEWGMILRYYPVSDRFVKGLGMEEVKDVTDVIPQLSAVDFPKGSSALYLPNLRKLFVKNTPANLMKLEQILSAFNQAEAKTSAEQVKIETRFVEFNEGALQELGFNWSDTANDGDVFGSVGTAANGSRWSVDDGQNLFTGGLRTAPFDQTKNLGLGENSSRTDSRIDNGTANRIEDTFGNPGEFRLSGKIAGNAVDLLIRALDQASGTDVLSAPSVTTLSGQPAVITVGERHSYPGTYESGESQGTVLHVKYDDFKDKILGVEMTVTPTIKGDEIQMKINPKINELLGWQKFELASADTSYTYSQYRVGMQFEHDTVVAQLPLFNRREVKTEVTVASGSTIGMGGLIGEKTEAFSDRVPVLGSIPLVGRLFRSEGNRTVKRNLMIFVTATKVAPNGRIISERSFEK